MRDETAHRERGEDQQPRDEGWFASLVATAEQGEQDHDCREFDHEQRDPVEGDVIGQTERRREHVARREIKGLRPGDVTVVEEEHDDAKRHLDARRDHRDGVGKSFSFAHEHRTERAE